MYSGYLVSLAPLSHFPLYLPPFLIAFSLALLSGGGWVLPTVSSLPVPLYPASVRDFFLSSFSNDIRRVTTVGVVANIEKKSRCDPDPHRGLRLNK